jgi:RNA polymerase sigma factor for flagellar operon FliA
MKRFADSLCCWETHVALSDEQLENVWRDYVVTRDLESRNLLIEHYLPLAKVHGERIHSRLPAEVDLDDVIAAAIDGLRDAIGSFDPGRGVKFQTFCAPRMKGAVLDALRRSDHVTRLIRLQTTQLSASQAILRGRLGRTPSDEEVANHMRLSPAEYADVVRTAQAADYVGLDRTFSGADQSDECTGADFLSDPRAESPLQMSQREDVRRLVTKGLSATERMVLILYYYEEMTMKEIGATLGTSESRISQVHAQVIQRLREARRGRQDEFVPCAGK